VRKVSPCAQRLNWVLSHGRWPPRAVEKSATQQAVVPPCLFVRYSRWAILGLLAGALADIQVQQLPNAMRKEANLVWRSCS
jgi:hypothetical protein